MFNTKYDNTNHSEVLIKYKVPTYTNYIKVGILIFYYKL